MGYFVSKTWPWWLLAAVLAALIAWLLCRWWTRRAGADEAAASTGELTRLQGLLSGREGELNRLQTEHDDLKTGHAALAAEHASLAGEHATLTTDHASLQADHASLQADHAGQLEQPATLQPATGSADPEPSTEHLGRIDDLSAQVASLTARLETHQGDRSRLTAAYGRIAELEGDLAARPVATVPDVQAGGAALGQAVRLDDLTLVEGIGPKIAELCQAAGIRTWRELAATPVARLRQILDAAGPRFQVHDPGTWPRQAALLADGHWEPFKAWTDALKGGRTDE